MVKERKEAHGATPRKKAHSISNPGMEGEITILDQEKKRHKVLEVVTSIPKRVFNKFTSHDKTPIVQGAEEGSQPPHPQEVRRLRSRSAGTAPMTTLPPVGGNNPLDTTLDSVDLGNTSVNESVAFPEDGYVRRPVTRPEGYEKRDTVTPTVERIKRSLQREGKIAIIVGEVGTGRDSGASGEKSPNKSAEWEI